MKPPRVRSLLSQLTNYASKKAVAEQTQMSGAALGVCVYFVTANLNLNLFADFLASILIPRPHTLPLCGSEKSRACLEA